MGNHLGPTSLSVTETSTWYSIFQKTQIWNIKAFIQGKIHKQCLKCVPIAINNRANEEVNVSFQRVTFYSSHVNTLAGTNCAPACRGLEEDWAEDSWRRDKVLEQQPTTATQRSVNQDSVAKQLFSLLQSCKIVQSEQYHGQAGQRQGEEGQLRDQDHQKRRQVQAEERAGQVLPGTTLIMINLWRLYSETLWTSIRERSSITLTFIMTWSTWWGTRRSRRNASGRSAERQGRPRPPSATICPSVAPQTIPHRLTEQAVVEDYLIPKNSLSRSRKSLGLHEGSLSLAAPGGVQAGEILRALHISHIIKITTVHPWPNPLDRSTPDSSVVSCFYYSACLNKVYSTLHSPSPNNEL